MPGKGSRIKPLYEKQLSIGMFLVGFELCIWGLLQLYGVIPDGKNYKNGKQYFTVDL